MRAYHDSYLTVAMNPKQLVKAAMGHLPSVLRGRREKVTLVGTGLSGSMAVPLLAYRFRTHFAVLRKRNDGTHSFAGERLREAQAHFEGVFEPGGYWIFVDDFIASGGTYQRVRDGLKLFTEYNDFQLTFAGAFLYGGSSREAQFLATPEAVQHRIIQGY